MTWKRICGVDDVAENTVRKFDIEGMSILLVNYGAGYRAIPPVCPHLEEPLEESSVVGRCILTCTKHLWAWKLDTMEMQGETEKPLKAYEVKQENGAILVKVDKELTYEFDVENSEDDDDFFK